MFKKFLVIALALVMCLSFAACDMSELLKDPSANTDETQSTQLDGTLNSATKIDPYTIEYRDNGDGTCAVTNIVINSATYSFSSSDNVADEDVYIKYGSSVDGAYIINGSEVSDEFKISTIVGSFGSSVSIGVSSQVIDIVIPEKNPDGLTVTSIEFDGFDHIVPSRIGQKSFDTIFNNEKIDEFSKQKFLAYYNYDEESGEYIRADELAISDIIAISDMMLNDILLSESDLKNIYSEVGEELPNIALKVKSVTVPQTVVSISDNAFAWCYNLEKYDIPEGCEYNESIFVGSKFAK